MAKKTVVNSRIENMNMEIDYDKLAKAIVKAQEAAKNMDDSPQRDKVSFWKALKIAVIESRKSKGRMTAIAFTYLAQIILTTFFMLFITIAGLSGIGIFISLYYGAKLLGLSNLGSIANVVVNILMAILSFLLMSLSGAFGLALFGAANEIAYEKDRNYVVAILSAIASFSAMVISLVALFRPNM